MVDKNASSELWNKAKEIVADAIELPKSEQEAFIQARCRQVDRDPDPDPDLTVVREGDEVKPIVNTNDNVIDHTLLNEVRSLLAFGGDTDSFVDQPPNLAGDTVENRAPQRDWEHETLGAWQLDREIGRGGMGMVYLAHRADGAYQQFAAIKLLRGGGSHSNDAKSISRMQRERQTLAALSHPNIARLLDGGNAPDDTPYLVMEYIEGESIDTFCSSHELSMSARIQLMVSVCAAVQSAHQRLVIHRDLKPSNVMVTADGTPKLLDFGVARLLESQDNEIEQTQSALLFTPRYASPEQVRGLPVSVATDVYGLGLLLYELLAGESPYERLSSNSTNAATNAAAVMQTVMGDALRKPSTVAMFHHPENVDVLKGDLDTILLKACAKEVNERYATVADLSADLLRYLANQPIAAREPTWGYVANKFLRRHVVGTTLGALAFVAVVAGFAGTVIQKNRAEAERAKAAIRYKQVRLIANSFIYKYYDEIQTLPGSQKVLKEMSSDGLKFLDYLYVDAANDPSLSAELGAGYGRLASVLYNGRNLDSAGDKVAASAALEKAKQLLTDMLGRVPNDVRGLYEMAKIESNESSLFVQEGNPEAGLAKADSAIARLQKVLAIDPANYDAGYHLPQAYIAAAQAKGNLKQPADQHLDKAGIAIEQWAALNKNDPEVGNLRLLLIRRKYLNEVSKQDWPAALQFSEQEILGDEAIVKKYENDFVFKLHLQTALLNKGGILNILKRPTEALPALTRGLEVSKIMLSTAPDSIAARAGEARIYFHYAKASFLMGRKNEAMAAFAGSADDYRLLDGKDIPPSTTRQRGETLWWLSKMNSSTNDREKLKQIAQELSMLAAKNPDIFGQPLAARWVEDAKKLAGI